MSGVKLASPTFSAGPQDDLAVADIYDGKEISVLNSIQKLSKQKEEEVIKMAEMRGSISAASKLSSWLKSSINFALPDTASMLSRLKASASPYLSAVKNAQDSIKGAISGAMPMIDSAKNAVSQVQNTVGGAISSVSSAAKSVTSTVNSVKSGIESVKSQVNGITNSVNTVKSSITNSITSAKNSISEVGRSVDKLTGRSAAAKNLSHYPAGVGRDQVYVKVGTALSKISSTQIQSFNDIASVLNSIKNEKLINIEDKESTAAVLAGVVKAASGNHLYGTFEAVIKGIDDAAIIRSVAALSLPTMLRVGDITSMRQIAETLTPSVITMINSEALTELAKNYQEKKRLTVNERLVRYQDIVTLFSLIDPTWNRTVRSTQAGLSNALNMVVFKSASAHFTETLRLGSLSATTPVEKAYSLITVLPITDVESALKKSFPLTVIGKEARVSRSSTDPRAVAA